MTTKEQANEAADALLAAAQTEQKRAAERNTLPLVRMYPALKDIPALERIAAVRDARDLAHTHSVSRALIALVTIALAALISLSLTGHPDWALKAGWAAALLFLSRQVLEQLLMRRYFQSLSKGPRLANPD